MKVYYSKENLSTFSVAPFLKHALNRVSISQKASSTCDSKNVLETNLREERRSQEKAEPTFSFFSSSLTSATAISVSEEGDFGGQEERERKGNKINGSTWSVHNLNLKGAFN